jgi:deazaflavin-dependent oxidoreductase (nitroreductase family)
VKAIVQAGRSFAHRVFQEVEAAESEAAPSASRQQPSSLYTRALFMNEEIEHNKNIIKEFRANGGKLGGYFAGRTLLLLHTIGAKSQQERVNPTAYVRDNERFVIIASNSGEAANPGWYYNIVANPLVTIEVGAEKFQARAAIAEEPERTRLYDKMVEMMPGFGEYQLKAARSIPVVVLTPIK